MYKWIGLILLPFCSLAQPAAVKKIALGCSTASLKKNLYYMASDEMQGRFVGSHGDTLVSLFVADWFRKHGVKAPYTGDSYIQAVTAYEIKMSAGLSIAGKEYGQMDGWSLYPRAPIAWKQVPVLVTGHNTTAAFLQALATLDLKGKAVFLSGKVFNPMLNDNSIDSVEAILKSKGAVGVIWSDATIPSRLERFKGMAKIPMYDNMFTVVEQQTAFPELAITAARFNELLAADNLQADNDGNITKSLSAPVVLKTSLSLYTNFQKKAIPAPNVIGVLPGTDTSLSCIVVTAHHDHDGVVDGVVYPGAVDNASGTAAVLEMTALLHQAALKGLRPKRTIVLASVTGEERGMIGSSWYVDHPLYPLSKTHAVLNIDMMGRIDTFYSGKRADSNYAYILVKDSLDRGLRKSLYDANGPVKLKLDTHYEDPRYSARRVTGSDQYPFFVKGVPFIRIDCGFSIDYHKPTDTPDKINYPLLTRQTQLAFLTLWNMADR
jgi:hypothetical protein